MAVKLSLIEEIEKDSVELQKKMAVLYKENKHASAKLIKAIESAENNLRWWRSCELAIVRQELEEVT